MPKILKWKELSYDRREQLEQELIEVVEDIELAKNSGNIEVFKSLIKERESIEFRLGMF